MHRAVFRKCFFRGCDSGVSVKAWLLAAIAIGHKDTKTQRFAKSKSGMNDGTKKARKTQRESDFV